MKELNNKSITHVINSHYPNSYTVDDTGVYVREINIKSCCENKTEVRIAMITDAHLNTEKTEYEKALVNAMKLTACADQLVLCGDNVESVSSDENLALLKENVWNVYPDTITILGNHEYFYPFDSSTDALKEKIDRIWPHNPDYYSRLVGGKVLVVTADNARAVEYGNWTYYFTKDKCELLRADIEYARKNGYIILFFCHVGLTLLDKTVEANGEMLDIIKTNSDVIKGCFSGHGHKDGKAAINADDGLLQYWLCGCCEGKGHILFINVK
ncbi:MAG: hypothetical protein E7621_02390 [Ruminococcaceae bacterium]|nr:hypothetical protein [Oscillospiraceae bacterium]